MQFWIAVMNSSSELQFRIAVLNSSLELQFWITVSKCTSSVLKCGSSILTLFLWVTSSCTIRSNSEMSLPWSASDRAITRTWLMKLVKLGKSKHPSVIIWHPSEFRRWPEPELIWNNIDDVRRQSSQITNIDQGTNLQYVKNQIKSNLILPITS